MQVYLPDALHKQAKAHGLPVSKLLRTAVEVELRRLHLLAATDRYIADLSREVGTPTAAQRSRAEGLARRVALRSVPKAG
jgi:post-segregation antitoxin (ccd killing protein)